MGMTEKRYFKKMWEEEYYIFDSNTISESDFEEKLEYQDYEAFEDSMMGDEVVNRLNELNNENKELKKENEQLKQDNDNLIHLLENQSMIIQELHSKLMHYELKEPIVLTKEDLELMGKAISYYSHGRYVE